MTGHTSYYLYQKYEKRGDQDWIPVYPNVYSVDGDGTKPLVIRRENDYECGYHCDTQYRWVSVPIQDGYICDECDINIEYRWVSTSAYTYFGDYRYEVLQEQFKKEGGEWQDTQNVKYANPVEVAKKLKVTFDNGDVFSQSCGTDDGVWYPYIEQWWYRIYSEKPIQHTTNIVDQNGVPMLFGDLGFVDTNGSSTQAGTYVNKIEFGDCVTDVDVSHFQDCGAKGLVFSSGVTSITSSFADNNLINVTCLATTPPTLDGHPFDISENLVIYVPSGSVETYKQADGWSYYVDYIQAYPPAVQYKWTPSGYTCNGYDKWEQCVKEISYDAGITWTPVSPIETSATTLIEVDSEDCGYVPPAPPFDGKIKLEYSDGTSYSADCNSTTILSESEVKPSGFQYTAMTSCTLSDICVTMISGSAFYGCTSLTNIAIPEKVVLIGYYAFCDCTSLSSVTVSSTGGTAIWSNAFLNCTSLTNIVLSSGVTYIGNYAFENCESLSSVTINATTPPTLGSDVFYNTPNNLVINVPCESIDDYKQANGWSDYESRIVGIPPCGESTQYRWTPSGYTCIGYDKWVQSVKEVSYDSGLTWSAVTPTVTSATSLVEVNSEDCGYVPPKFKAKYSGGTSYSAGCDSNTTLTSATTKPSGYVASSMTSSEIGSCITTIDTYAFNYCTSLSSVTIPDSVTTIGDMAFGYCHNLTSITIPNSVTTIGYAAFGSCGFSSITIPDSVTSLGNGAFDNCTSMTSCTIGSGVTSIGNNVFNYCTSLTSIVIPDSVTSIGSNAFKNCRSLSGVAIPDSVTSIGNSAFIYCSGLTSVTIGSGVTTIGDTAFLNCSGLTSVTIPSGVTSIGNQAFSRCFAIISSVTIPDSVTSIGRKAFEYCIGLSSLTIGNGVTTIGNNAFLYCSGMTACTIGSGVTGIGEYTFRYCESLSSVTITATTPPTLGYGALFSTSSNLVIYVPSGSVETYKQASGWSNYTSKIRAIP